MVRAAAAASLRVKKDINELITHRFTCDYMTTYIEFPTGVDNLLSFHVTVSVQDSAGPYSNGSFKFKVDIPPTYPFHAPQVVCLHSIWHPNIDPVTRNVVLPILGADWRPVLTINTVLLGLQLIFLEPNVSQCANVFAAQQFMHDPVQYTHQMQQIMQGGYFFGYEFPVRLSTSIVQRKKRHRVQHDEDEDEDEDVDASPLSSEHVQTVKRNRL